VGLVGVPVEGVEAGFDRFGGELAGGAGKGEDFVAAHFDGPGLVDVDAAAVRGDHPLVGGEEGVDDRGVGLGAADEEFDFGVGTAAGPADAVFGGGADGVFAVAGVGRKIGF
jgi:hypothetical protein